MISIVSLLPDINIYMNVCMCERILNYVLNKCSDREHGSETSRPIRKL